MTTKRSHAGHDLTQGDDSAADELDGRGMAPLVVAQDLSRTFGSGSQAVVAVHSANCTVNPLARIAITGPSGSGKSTLLHLFGGLDVPTSGSLSWPPFGHTPGPSEVGTVFQGASLVPALTAIENVALPLVLQGIEQTDAEAQAHTALTLLGVHDLGNKLPEELSGGQAQRVSVARVVAARPRLILADEPTGQLDQRAAARVVDVLISVADQLGAGLVVSTHDPHIASRLGLQWTMSDGRLETNEHHSTPVGAS